MECDRLLLAAKEGDLATIETLINAKHIDVNIKKPLDVEDEISQVIIIFVQLMLILNVYM